LFSRKVRAYWWNYNCGRLCTSWNDTLLVHYIYIYINMHIVYAW